MHAYEVQRSRWHEIAEYQCEDVGSRDTRNAYEHCPSSTKGAMTVLYRRQVDDCLADDKIFIFKKKRKIIALSESSNLMKIRIVSE